MINLEFLNGFSPLEINDINTVVEKYPVVDGVIVSGDGKHAVGAHRKTDIRWIKFDEESQWIFERIRDVTVGANNEIFGFNIEGGLTEMQYAVYNAPDNHYSWHIDIGADSLNRKISVSVQLSDSDEYEGGDLEFFSSKIVKATRKKGAIIFFPSYVAHRVTPVTKGCRRSLVYWICGPSFV